VDTRGEGDGADDSSCHMFLHLHCGQQMQNTQRGSYHVPPSLQHCTKP
jgi:hypothetical protein